MTQIILTRATSILLFVSEPEKREDILLNSFSGFISSINSVYNTIIAGLLDYKNYCDISTRIFKANHDEKSSREMQISEKIVNYTEKNVEKFISKTDLLILSAISHHSPLEIKLTGVKEVLQVIFNLLGNKDFKRLKDLLKIQQGNPQDEQLKQLLDLQEQIMITKFSKKLLKKQQDLLKYQMKLHLTMNIID